jgi:hypothetical protein
MWRRNFTATYSIPVAEQTIEKSYYLERVGPAGAGSNAQLCGNILPGLLVRALKNTRLKHHVIKKACVLSQQVREKRAKRYAQSINPLPSIH